MNHNDCNNNNQCNNQNYGSAFLIVIVLYILIAIILGSRSNNFYY